MDLSALSDDAVVAEMRRRLDRGTVGYEGLLSTDQAHWRDCWHALVSVISSCRNRYPNEFGTRLILDKVHELIDRAGRRRGFSD